MNKTELLEKLDLQLKDPTILDKILGEVLSPEGERLEYLGDRLLWFVISDYLFCHPLGLNEGQLSMFASAISSNFVLAKVSEDIGLGAFPLKPSETLKPLADRLEALIGTIYAEQGYEVAVAFIKKFIFPMVDDFLVNGYSTNPNHQKELIRQKFDLIVEVLGKKPKIDFYKKTGGGKVQWTAVMSLNGREYGRAKSGRQEKAREEVINLVFDRYVPK
ncbi:MAG: ribonuclease III domain-containing protein [Patescibacteria group bacterium]|nr:ribonuclease III domain-containing protein [Patescibacteria group bacterium]MCL5093673.1 ribonuclease III domain-containing protein [Patescibacteria group bacterium]